jgi:hypothetical protein
VSRCRLRRSLFDQEDFRQFDDIAETVRSQKSRFLGGGWKLAARSLYNGESLGAIVHFNDRNSIWIQETFNKIITVPWYTAAAFRLGGAHGRVPAARGLAMG